MQVNHVTGKKITLCQNTYFKKVLNCFKMTECKPASILMNSRVTNSLLLYNKNADKETIKWYQSAIESLIWPFVYNCPDIVYVLGILS